MNRRYDEAVVVRACSGERLRLNPLETEEAVRRLNRAGLSDMRISERIGVTQRTVLRVRSRLGLKPAFGYEKSSSVLRGVS